MSKLCPLVIACAVFAVMLLAGCQQKSEAPSPIATSEPLSAVAQEELDRLNAWDVQATAIVECPKDYPGFIDSGETRGWIFTREKNLQELGVSVRWNCEIKAYEVIPKGQASIPLCGCPPIK